MNVRVGARVQTGLEQGRARRVDSVHEVEAMMGLARYAIVGNPGDWHVEHDGKVAHTYVTKESAFEAAAAAASLAMREGHEIIITVPGSDGGLQTATGARG
jgi:hypothetical protein